MNGFGTLEVQIDARADADGGSDGSAKATAECSTRMHNCSAASRRSLANAHRTGESSTRDAWRVLADCIAVDRRRRPGVMLLHVSKSGGTTMCAQAVQAGCRDARWAEYHPRSCGVRPPVETTRVGTVAVHLSWDNCMGRYFDDGPMWVMEPASPAFEWWIRQRPSNRESRGMHSCEARARWLASRGATFHSVEGPLSDAMTAAAACVDVMTRIILIRDPIERAYSHVQARK